MKITGKIEGRELRMVITATAGLYACVERTGSGPVWVIVVRNGLASNSTHATLDAAIACAQDAVAQ